MKNNFLIAYKSHIFNSCVVPALTYGCQTWSATKKIEKKMQYTQNSVERSMLNIRLKDKVTITKIKTKFKINKNVIHHVKRLKWNWAGHVCRLKDQQWMHRVTFLQIRGGRKPGKQRARWSNNIYNFIKNKQFHRIAYDLAEWARLSEAYAQNLGFVSFS